MPGASHNALRQIEKDRTILLKNAIAPVRSVLITLSLNVFALTDAEQAGGVLAAVVPATRIRLERPFYWTTGRNQTGTSSSVSWGTLSKIVDDRYFSISLCRR